MILGKLIPVGALGVYSVALKIVSVPMEMIVMLTGRVVHPVLAARARRDLASMISSLERVRCAMLPASMFVALGALFFSPFIVDLVYDDRYSEAGWMGQLMALPVWFAAMEASVDRVLFARGESRPAALVNLV